MRRSRGDDVTIDQGVELESEGEMDEDACTGGDPEWQSCVACLADIGAEHEEEFLRGEESGEEKVCAPSYFHLFRTHILFA